MHAKDVCRPATRSTLRMLLGFFFFFLACEVEHHFYFSAWPKTGGLQRPVATEADQEPRSQEITVWQSSNTTALGYDGLMSLFIIIIPLCRE